MAEISSGVNVLDRTSGASDPEAFTTVTPIINAAQQSDSGSHLFMVVIPFTDFVDSFEKSYTISHLSPIEIS
jgi:hypothetical protein